ncbi:MAG TPA: two-component system activity regulator YycH [Clostridia bacterium]|nr:two-component system activity regulator YycH [Clostridia bacterium]
MNRERLKTLILSILVIISVILTQQLWFPSPVNTLKMGAGANKDSHMTVIEERKNIVSPKTIIVSFGVGDRKKNYYTILSSDIDSVWNRSKVILRDYFSGDPEIIPVEHDVYVQAGILKSIELEFGDNMPTALISSVFDSSDSKIVKNIKEIKKILIPAFNQGTIYIAGSKEDDIYEARLYGYEKNTALVDFIDELEGKEFTKYHPVSSLFDDIDENYTIIPINYALTAKQIFVESEIDVKDEIRLREYVKNFFGEGFDFVKTIKETSGAVVYIYGYGEKSVRINKEGILEYNEEIGSMSGTNVLVSLDAAVDFVCENGGFPEGTYLKHVQAITDGQNKGYRFLFGYRMGGLPIEFDRNKMESPLKIEVYGNKVKTYHNLVRRAMNMQGVDSEQKILYFPSIIEKNIRHLELLYPDSENQSKKGKHDEEKISQILKDIEEVRLVYFDTMERQRIQLLRPGWRMKIKNYIYYFDGYTGELIGRFMPD